jgi:magnesium chelatase family protein
LIDRLNSGSIQENRLIHICLFFIESFMVAKIKTVSFQGTHVLDVDVEVQIAGGMVAFTIVGLPDKAVAESRERVRASLQSMGLALPAKRVTVNLAPADVLKEGSHYDLPIALGLLTAMEILPAEEMHQFYALGELGLDANLRRVTGVLPASLHALSKNTGLICPFDNALEAAWAGNDSVLAPKHLLQMVNHFKGTQILTQPKTDPDFLRAKNADKVFPDLAHVKGQETAKRALEVAASGGHNMLMLGPPGSGKSMLASCLPSLLPPLTAAEALEVSIIHSLAGTLPEGGLILDRPFRDPHHSASQPALIGGGSKAKPGEISLAHHGVLFLDELPEFARASLESMRQPLETGEALVARVNYHVTYPAKFQLLAAMNPCRCGYLGDPTQECSKAPRCGEEYQGKLSGPLLDRIDLQIDVPALTVAELSSAPTGEPSKIVAERIAACRAFQKQRFEFFYPDQDVRINAHLTSDMVEKMAVMDDQAKIFLERAAHKLKLSARGWHRALKVARTIADLAQVEILQKSHIAEALSYRRLKNLET